jgi:predicted SAM-dependent methyltransferase
MGLAEHIKIAICHVLYYPFILRHYLAGRHATKLHVGCGTNRFDGWINADITPRADLIIFLEKKLPFKSNTLDRIYSEHVLEHVSFGAGVSFLREALRVLKPGGVIRIAMPDLDELIDGYQKDWKRFDWIKWPAYSFIKTRAEMINVAFRWWGHQHLYNSEEISRALVEAGFSHMSFPEHGESDFEDLRGLESRVDSKLIVEAIKQA